MKTFNIHIETDVELTELEIWPDGDVPDDPTAEDVRDLILSIYRDPEKFLREWSLIDSPWIDVDKVVVWR